MNLKIGITLGVISLFGLLISFRCQLLQFAIKSKPARQLQCEIRFSSDPHYVGELKKFNNWKIDIVGDCAEIKIPGDVMPFRRVKMTQEEVNDVRIALSKIRRNSREDSTLVPMLGEPLWVISKSEMAEVVVFPKFKNPDTRSPRDLTGEMYPVGAGRDRNIYSSCKVIIDVISRVSRK